MVAEATAAPTPASVGAACTRAPADWPMSTSSSRRPRTSASVPRPGAERPGVRPPRRREARQELAQGGAASVLGRGAEERRPGPAGRNGDLVASAGRREAAGEDDHQVRAALGRRGKDRRELGHERPLVGGGRVPDPGQHGGDPRVGERGGDGDDLRPVDDDAMDAPAGPGRRGGERELVPVRGREDGELGRGGGLGLDARQRGRAVRLVEAQLARELRVGLDEAAPEAFDQRLRDRRSAGPAVAPRRRQCPSTRPMSEVATVAVPRSTAAKARGSLLTGPMLPAAGAPGPARGESPSGVPAVGLVQLLEPVDERLDPDVVAQQLGRGRRSRRRTARPAPGRRTASRARRGAGTGGWPRGSAPQARSGPVAGSHARPPRRGPRGARPRLHREAHARRCRDPRWRRLGGAAAPTGGRRRSPAAARRRTPRRRRRRGARR